MLQKADHSHHAAVHLMKALKCCKECGESDDIIKNQIQQLEKQRQYLANELKHLHVEKIQSEQLEIQIYDISQLCVNLKNQNQQAYQSGMIQVQRLCQEKQRAELQEHQHLIKELKKEKEMEQKVYIQMQNLIEQVRYLNQINNEIIDKFRAY